MEMIENINAIANKRATLHSADVNRIMEISYTKIMTKLIKRILPWCLDLG